jgi:putative ABC transport system ATP-binding protein
MIQSMNIGKTFRTRSNEVRALDDVTLDVQAGQFVVVRGPSGSGKTTLLLALGAMQHPSRGEVLFDGQDIYALSERQRAQFRADNIGFVFQMFHLVPYLTVLENVCLAATTLAGRDLKAEARSLLNTLGLSPREDHTPSELSAGERQRTAIARAMLNRPKLILADEPTGNLDEENAAEVMEALAAFNRQGGTVIVVTHGRSADAHAHRIVRLKDGRIVQTDTE